MRKIENIINLIEKNNKFLIVSHQSPDCDAIGSTIALSLALQKLGKKVFMYNKDSVPGYLEFLKESSKIKKSLNEIDDEVSVVILLDCAEFSRPGKDFEEYITKKDFEIAYIDHHKTNGISSDYALIDENISSTGILIYELIKFMNVEMDKDIAESIFCTIIGDTGSFRYSNTYAETFEIAGELVKLGANPGEISKYIYDEEPLNKIRLLGLIINTLELDDEGKIAFIHVDNEMYESTDTTKEDTEGAVNIARSINGVEVAAFFKQVKNTENSEWKISLRSKDYVDVSKLAQSFGGGGHHKASGCTIHGSLQEAKTILYSKIVKLI